MIKLWAEKRRVLLRDERGRGGEGGCLYERREGASAVWEREGVAVVEWVEGALSGVEVRGKRGRGGEGSLAAKGQLMPRPRGREGVPSSPFFHLLISYILSDTLHSHVHLIAPYSAIASLAL